MSEDFYSPDQEEVNDAISFMNSCTSEDLINGWSKISQEWDIAAVQKIHRAICDSGRMNTLLGALSDS